MIDSVMCIIHKCQQSFYGKSPDLLADSHRGCAYDSTWGTLRLPDRLLLPPPGNFFSYATEGSVALEALDAV